MLLIIWISDGVAKNINSGIIIQSKLQILSTNFIRNEWKTVGRIFHYDIWSEGVNSLTISMVASKQVIRENKLSNKRASFCKTLISNLKGNVLLLKGTIIVIWISDGVAKNINSGIIIQSKLQILSTNFIRNEWKTVGRIFHYDIWSEGVNSLTISMVASKQVIRENKLSNKRASFCKTLIIIIADQI